VGLAGFLEVGLTSALGGIVIFGLLQRRSADIRIVTALFVGLGALSEGLASFRVLTHSVALSAVPTLEAQVGVAVSLGLGAGLAGIVLRGLPEVSPGRSHMAHAGG
jgi:hypothetical protein